MATNPSQTSQDLTVPSPYVPTRAELENRLTQLRSRLPQPNRNPPPSPNNQTRPFLAYLAFRSIFLPHESAGWGAYLSFLSQSAFFFSESFAE